MTSAFTCGLSLSITCARMGLPPSAMSPLSPPPMRRARPPARMTPATSAILGGTLALMLAVFLLHRTRIGIENDPLLARKRDEALPACPPDEREIGLSRQFHPRCGEPRSRCQYRNAHLNAFYDHFRGEPTGGIENFIPRIDPVEEHPAGNLVRRIVAPDVLDVNQRPVALRQHAPVNCTGLEVERRHRVDFLHQLVEPARPHHGAGGELDGSEMLHEIAEHGALRAAR